MPSPDEGHEVSEFTSCHQAGVYNRIRHRIQNIYALFTKSYQPRGDESDLGLGNCGPKLQRVRNPVIGSWIQTLKRSSQQHPITASRRPSDGVSEKLGSPVREAARRDLRRLAA